MHLNECVSLEKASSSLFNVYIFPFLGLDMVNEYAQLSDQTSPDFMPAPPWCLSQSGPYQFPFALSSLDDQLAFSDWHLHVA